MRIVAEHSRAVTFLVGDERTPVLPSNEERGYVVRRMLRRTVYFGRRHLRIEEPFMAALADTVVDAMAPAYPELERQRAFVKEILEPEERRFDETLSRGLEMLEGVLERAGASRSVSGADAFLLHDTYGFPVELTREIAAEHALTVEEAGFEAEMEQQRHRARAAVGGVGAVAADALYGSLGVEASRLRRIRDAGGAGQDRGVARRSSYECLKTSGKRTMVLRTARRVSGGEPVETAAEGDRVEVLLDETPFYPEGGGQVGDRGEIVGPSGRVVVEDTQRVAERLIVHRGRVVEGRIAVGDEVTARVDAGHRADTMRNHTATHSAARGTAEGAGDAREAGGIAGGAGPPSLRFHAH